MTAKQPLKWTKDELEASRSRSLAIFRDQRIQEPLEEYLEAFDTYRAAVEDLLETTVDLARLREMAVELLTNADMLLAVRYLASPPISKDDLEALAETKVSRTVLRADVQAALRVIDHVLLGLDRNRFPWVGEDREPTESERGAASLATAALMAVRRVMTRRANEAKSTQEEAVKARLRKAGMHEVAPRTINTTDAAPARGEFCGECSFGGRKADIVVRLWDGRVMPTECKVSNSATNSVKRLNNDAAVKAGVWIDAFGTLQTVPAAVLSGVFKRHNLENAQERGLTLFWAHDLDRMIEFIESTREPS